MMPPTVTPAQIRAVQASFARVFPRKAALSEHFYDLLFGQFPELRPLFPDDMRAQRGKLADMLALIVRGLNAPDHGAHAASDLARRHRGYGVLAAHYSMVGTALIGALKATVPGGLTDEELGAWQGAYGLLASVMIAAAHPEEADSAA